MRNALVIGLVLLIASPAAAQDVAVPDAVTTAYSTTPIVYSVDLSPSPTNPRLSASPGGQVISVRGILSSSPDPEVATWLHDFGTGVTERVDLEGSFETRILGMSSDGDLLLLADDLGLPYLRQRSTNATVALPPADDAETQLLAIALSADGGTAWLQWAAPITEPDQRSAGLAVFEQDGSLGEGSITILAEDLPLAGSPSLDWYLRDGGLVVELVGPAGATPLAGLGSPADVRSARISAPRADGSITIALVSTSTALPGAGGARCDGAPCAELYRTTLRNGVLASPELLSIGDDGTRIEDDVVGVSLSPNGDLVAFVTATSLLPGLAAAGVANTYVAGAQHLRSISSFEVVDTAVNGGRFPAFLSNNQLVFYADLTSLPAGGVADVPIPGLRIAQIQPFDDMAVTVHEGAIWWAVERGITEGCAVGRYCPTRPLTRGQMASLVARALELAPSGSGPFDDVAGIHAPAINAIAAAGITAGCDANSFCPEDPVSRAQMAAFLARALGLEPLASGSFADAVGVHGGAINAIEAAGISNGCAPGRYCPEVAVTRAQMATFLFRAFSGQPG